MNMVDKRAWSEFQSTGLLWWINRILHTFGWAIVFEVETDNTISDVYPARVKFRGFDTDSEEQGFRRLSNYMVDNATELKDEADE